MVISAINCFSVKLSSRINSVFGIGKVVALLIIIVFGIVNLFKGKLNGLNYFYLIYMPFSIGKNENLKLDIAISETNPVKYVTAFYYGLFTYDGWSSLNNLTEELKNPRRNLPLAIGISLVSIIFLYLMANISYLTVLSPNEMITSSAVALVRDNNFII